MSLFNKFKPEAPKEPDPEPVVEAKEPAPSYVTPDQLAQMNQQINGQLSQLQENLLQLAQRGAQPPQQPPPVSEVSEQEIEEALQRGENVGAIIKKALQQTEARLVQQYIAPMQNEGMATIAQLSERAMRTEMPYYELLQDNVQKTLKNMEPSLRMRPDVIKHVYDSVVGQNIGKIVQLEIEKQVRATRAAEGGGAQDTSTTKGGEKVEVGSFEEVFGKEALDAIKHLKGSPDPDEFARRLGYKDAKDYLKRAAELEA